MPEISKHPVNNVHRTSDSMQSAYLSHNLGNTAVPVTRTPSIVLTVMAFNNGSVVLQEQSSRKNIQVNNEQLRGVNLNQIAKGDQLILLSSDSQSAIFELKKMGSTAVSQVKLINSGLADALRKVWPDISADILRKLSPDVLSKVRFDVDSQVGISFSDALVKIAKINQQPNLDIKFSAIVKQVLNNSILLQVDLSNRHLNAKHLQLSVPLITELKQNIVNGASLDIQLDASADKKTIVKLINNNAASLSSNATSLSSNGILELNKIVNNQPRFRSSLDTLVSNLLFSNTNTKHHDVIIEGSKLNIHRLPVTIQYALTDQSDKQPFSKQDSQLIIQPKLVSNSHSVDLTWLAKPQILKIDITYLAKLSDVFSNSSNVNDNRAKHEMFAQTEQKTQTNKKEATRPITDSLLKQFLADKNNIVNSAAVRQLINHALGGSEQSQNGPKIDVNLVQNKKALLDSLTQLINQEQRIAVAKGDNPSASLIKVFDQLLAVKQQAHPQLKMMLENALPILTKLNGANELELNQAMNELVSVKTIKDMLSAPATQSLVHNQGNNSVLQLLSQLPSSSIINGLVKVLTASLLAKLNVSSSELSNLILSFSNVGNLDKKSTANKNLSNSSKAIQELNRLDPQGRIFNQINALLNQHRLQKLTAIESSIQGNESLQYSMPNPLSAESNDIQITIKKEQEKQNEDNKEEILTYWHLNMKLSVGEHGDALAKIKLHDQNIALNLYASNSALKSRIEKYLPLLNQRLENAGLKIKTNCFVGNIPTSIIKTNLQMVHTYA